MLTAFQVASRVFLVLGVAYSVDMVNRVILIGNAGRDAEIRRLDTGTAVAKFSVATNESYKDKAGEWQTVTEWHDIIAWRSLAEKAEASIKKGVTVYIEGKLTTRTWKDDSGNNRRTTEVVASYFRIIGAKSANSQNYFPESEPPGMNEAEPASEITSASEPAGSDEDLPF